MFGQKNKQNYCQSTTLHEDQSTALPSGYPPVKQALNFQEVSENGELN